MCQNKDEIKIKISKIFIYGFPCTITTKIFGIQAHRKKHVVTNSGIFGEIFYHAGYYKIIFVLR